MRMDGEVKRSLGELTAFHEAGHAVLAAAFGRRVSLLRLEFQPIEAVARRLGDDAISTLLRSNGGDWSGCTATSSGADGSSTAIALLAQAAAGCVADRIANGGTLPYEVAAARTRTDWNNALKIASVTADGDADEALCLLAAGREVAERVLRDPVAWRLVERLAERLGALRTLTADDVDFIWSQNPGALARAREVARRAS